MMPAAASSQAASITGNGNLSNQQWVTVNWSGFSPTKSLGNSFSDPVGIFECVAQPTDGQWNFYRDCDTEAVPNGTDAGDGNALDPALYPTMYNFASVRGLNTVTQQFTGFTGTDGTGSSPFEIQEGTLATSAWTVNQSEEGIVRSNPPKVETMACSPPGTYLNQFYAPEKTGCLADFSIQCDPTHPCVLKVVDFSAAFWKHNFGLPNVPPGVTCASTFKFQCDTSTGPGSWTQVVDAAPSIPINFGPLPNCPPPRTSTPNLSTEGAPSASYAIQAWGTTLCNSSHPLVVNYAPLVENLAKSDLASHATAMAIASLPPPSTTGLLAAPLDLSGVSIVFNVAGATSGQPDEQMRLTPRLAAMIISDSATQNPVTASPPGNIHIWTDPEFQALNPGFQPPSDGFNPPVLVAGTRDDASIITQWIADDYDARQYLAGQDPCSAPVYQYWKGVRYPTDQFLNYIPSTSQAPENAYLPVLINLLVGQDVAFDTPSGFGLSGSGQQSGVRLSSTLPSQDGIFGVVDSATANATKLPSAQLDAASPNTSQLSSYVDVNSTTHTCTAKSTTTSTPFPAFAGPTTAGLDTGFSAMKPGPAGMRQPPVAIYAPGAYPLTKVDYALVPAAGLSASNAVNIPTFLRYAAGPGQAPSVLPTMYPALPAAAAQQTLTVASDVSSEASIARSASLHTTTSTSSGTGLAGFSSSPSSLPGGASAAGSPNSTSGSAAAGSRSARGANGQTGSSAGGSGSGGSGGSGLGDTQQRAIDVVSAAPTGAWLVPLLASLALLLGAVAWFLRWRSRPAGSGKVIPALAQRGSAMLHWRPGRVDGGS